MPCGVGPTESGNGYPLPLKGMTWVPYCQGNWVQRWDMAVLWTRNPGLVITNFRSCWVRIGPPTKTPPLWYVKDTWIQASVTSLKDSFSFMSNGTIWLMTSAIQDTSPSSRTCCPPCLDKNTRPLDVTMRTPSSSFRDTWTVESRFRGKIEVNPITCNSNSSSGVP